MSKKVDDRLDAKRASLWCVMYIRHCLEVDRGLDELKLIKFDALVVAYRRGEITYQEFRDELDRLDNPESPCGCQR